MGVEKVTLAQVLLSIWVNSNGCHQACPVARGCVCSLSNSFPLCLAMKLRIVASLCFPQSCMNMCFFTHQGKGNVLSLSTTRVSLSDLFSDYNTATSTVFVCVFFGTKRCS